MAKVTFGPIVSEARNKVGGVVFSRNPHGAFSRAWSIPPYTNTAAQAAMRTALSTLSSRWRLTLTDEQREGWRSLGCRYKHVDVFAQKSNRPGLQAYLRANLALSSVGAATIDNAPRTQRATDPQAITATAASGLPPSIQVDALVDPQPSEAVQVWVSPQLGSGRNYFFRKMRLVHTEPAGTAAPWDPSAGWSSRFGELTFPSKLGVGVRYIDTNTGAIGPWRTALINSTEGAFSLTRTIVDLTNAQVLALPTTNVAIVPPPGVGFALVHIATFLYFTYVASPTNIDPTAEIRMIPSDESFQLSNWVNPNYILTGPNSAMGQLGLPTQNASTTIHKSHIDYAELENLGINIEIFNNGMGDFTGGDPGNALRVICYYDTVPLA